MSYTNINAATPLGTDKGKVLDNEIRDFKAGVKANLNVLSNYLTTDSQPSTVALKTAVWTTAGRPSGTSLQDKVTGYNTTLGCEEYYNLATTSWVSTSPTLTHNHSGAGETKIPTGGIADGILSADAAGLAKMADGFLSADTAGRAKMADGFVTAAKLAAGAISSNIAVITGTVSHGAQVPLPDGYTQEQCVWFVSPRDFGTPNFDVNEGGTQAGFTFKCYADPTTRVVTAQHGFNSQTAQACTANYITIGIK